MNRRSTSAGPIYILLLGLFIFGGCSDGPNKSVTPENNAPAILSCTADPATVPAGSTTTLTVDAVDEDGDELTYTWSADGGQFPDGNVGETVTWSPPDLMGTYTVTVTVDDGTTATDETIDLNVTVPEVVIDPAALDFGGDATSLQFSVTNAGDGVLQWSATDDSDWMSIDPAGGDVATGLGDAVTVTVDRTGLAPGSHDGTVTVTTPYGDGLVAVSLYVPATPALAVSTQALDFGAETVELQFEITNTGQGELTWTAAGSAGWLDVDPAGGATTSETDIVVVTIDRSGLDAGAHQGTVDIASNGGAESIAVDLLVSATPILAVSTQSLDFGADTVHIPFQITNTGQGELTWTVTASAAWLDVEPAAGDTREETDYILVTVDRTGLDPGAHQGTVDIASSGGGESITVDMLVSAPPALTVSTQLLDFGVEDLELSFEITNTGQGELAWTVAGSAAWLAVDPAGGATTSETDVITVTADRSGLAPDVYQDTVDIASNGGQAAVTVTLTVPAPVPPAVALSPLTLDFGTATTSLGLDVTNAGEGTLTWTATTEAAFIGLDP
ncbi:PKD domain-containing protein, partial [bacterium]|nr:PKD domain-containing protein [bacterium]